MTGVSGPYLVRDEHAAAEPALYSPRNLRREIPARRPARALLRRVRMLLLLLGVSALGYYGYSVADQYVYQAYENWSFDQQIAGRTNVTFADYLREQTPLGFVAGTKETATPAPIAKENAPSAPVVPHGAILGRVSIARLGISAMVREGVDAGTLRTAVGHVPSTALPGQPGNFSIAAHRDTLFRALRNIRTGDEVDFQSTTGNYAYRVIATQIVRPSNVSVLRADGGPGLLQKISDRPKRLLTMITCYPFNYIGSAPERFIVQAQAVDETPVHAPVVRHRATRTRATLRRRTAPPAIPVQAQVKPKKRGFWHRLFRLG